MKKIMCLIFIILFVFLIGGCGMKSNKGVLKIGVDCSVPPYCFYQNNKDDNAQRDSVTNKFINGYDILWGNMMAKKLGYEKAEYTVFQRDELENALVSGKVNCVIAALSPSQIKSSEILSSEAYYRTFIAVMVKRNSEYSYIHYLSDLKGVKGAYIKGTRWSETISRNTLIDFDCAADSFEDAVKLVAEGKYPVAVCDFPTAKCAMKYNKKITYKSFIYQEDDFEKNKNEMNAVIAVSKNSRRLLDEINQLILSQSLDDMEEMMRKAIDSYGKSIGG